MSDVHSQGRFPSRGIGLTNAGLEILDRPAPSRRRPRIRSLLGAVVVAGLLGLLGVLAGCSGASECRLTSDCPAPLFCVEGLCVAECRDDRDCPADETCQSGRCGIREAGERLCTTSFTCEVGERCVDGVCRADRPVADAGVASPDAGPDLPEPGDAGATDAGPSGLPYGAVCTRAADCASGLCLAPQGSGSGRCTERCASDGDCFYPDACLELGAGERLCGQASTGRPTGAPCPNGPSECATGLCVDSGNGAGPICTQPCGGLPTCPAGLTCQPVPDGQGGAVAVCIQGTGGGFGEGCAAAADCATGLCVEVGSGGVCTTLCAQVPCPLGWSCTLAEDAAGNDFRICAPEGAAGGRLGDPCTGASACASGLCLFDARTGSAFCTERCQLDRDCSAEPGLGCVTLATGARVCGPL